MQKKRLIIAVILFLFIGISGLVYGSFFRGSETEDLEGSWTQTGVEESSEGEAIGAEITSDVKLSVKLAVYICGAVNRAGVYELEEGARLQDAVDLAGGLAKEAAAGEINLAQVLKDGERYYIPTEQEVEEGWLTEEKSGLININKAGLQELMSLPGIGESKAAGIIAYREAHGAFASVDDLCQVDGIKEGILNGIRSRITVD